jgi:monoamine oxidase
LRFFWLEECLGGTCRRIVIKNSYLRENLFCAGTYAKILDSIAKSALKNAGLKLPTKVTRIETALDKVKVVTDKGVEEEFDEVVMTAPLGYLKQNMNTFVPPLPQRLSQAIDAIGHGSMEVRRSNIHDLCWKA